MTDKQWSITLLLCDNKWMQRYKCPSHPKSKSFYTGLCYDCFVGYLSRETYPRTTGNCIICSSKIKPGDGFWWSTYEVVHRQCLIEILISKEFLAHKELFS